MSLLDEMLRVRQERGVLTGEEVVAAATPKTHPLHDRFEWDNKVAGHRYRVIQADELIRTVKITAVDSEELRPVRAFVSVPRPEGRQYEPTTEVAEDPVAKALVLQEMKREWFAFKRRYEHMAEFMQLLQAEQTSAA
jgi:hypothetical protein